jgi:hypothetical protein
MAQGLRQHGYENLVVVSPPEAWDNPRLVTKLMAERGSVTTALSMESYVYSDMMLANMGMLGGDIGIADLYSGPTDVDDRLALIQEFEGQLEPGQSVDPSAVYAKVFQRVQKTDPNDMSTGPADPGYPYNQIAITNSALVTANFDITEDARRALVLRLSNAEDDYLFALAKGEMTMTYSEYLASIKDLRRL